MLKLYPFTEGGTETQLVIQLLRERARTRTWTFTPMGPALLEIGIQVWPQAEPPQKTKNMQSAVCPGLEKADLGGCVDLPMSLPNSGLVVSSVCLWKSA